MARLQQRRGLNEDRKRSQTHKARRESIKNQRRLIMLACEGQKTERFYFEEIFDRLKRSHAISKISCVIARHTHTNPGGVLDDLLNFVTDTGCTYKDYEEKWIVIDRDEERTGGGGHTLEDYMNAIDRARSKHVEVAWSNPSFEIWYLLHFQNRITSIHRDEVIRCLSECLGKEYQKNDRTLFSTLEPMMNDAIRFANRLLTEAAESGRQSPQVNPATKVVKLVEKLLEHEKG